MDVTPTLYVFVNTDLESMNPGKAQAHSGHAANAFIERAVVKPLLAGEQPDSLVTMWRTSTPQGFGTQINLKVPASYFKNIVEVATRSGFISEVVFDPTYPYFVDKEIYSLIPETVHTAPAIVMGDKVLCFRHEMTAAYIFGDKAGILPIITGRFPLHD